LRCSRRYSPDWSPPSTAPAQLDRVLDAIGFQPEVRTGSDGTEVLLHHCPFREVAERHTDVICAIHLGLMQGALDELRAPLQATSLEPLVSPNLCVARLQGEPSDDGD
jgi:predicted ArsR family transcriptional regulator